MVSFGFADKEAPRGKDILRVSNEAYGNLFSILVEDGELTKQINQTSWNIKSAVGSGKHQPTPTGTYLDRRDLSHSHAWRMSDILWTGF